MSTFKLIALACATLAVVACGKTSSQKAAAEANSKIEQMSQIDQVLKGKGIVLSREEKFDEKRTVPTSHNLNDLLVIRAMLEQYIALGQDVLNITNRGDVNVAHANTVPEVKFSVADAARWLKKIQHRTDEIRGRGQLEKPIEKSA